MCCVVCCVALCCVLVALMQQAAAKPSTNMLIVASKNSVAEIIPRRNNCNAFVSCRLWLSHYDQNVAVCSIKWAHNKVNFLKV